MVLVRFVGSKSLFLVGRTYIEKQELIVWNGNEVIKCASDAFDVLK